MHAQLLRFRYLEAQKDKPEIRSKPDILIRKRALTQDNCKWKYLNFLNISYSLWKNFKRLFIEFLKTNQVELLWETNPMPNFNHPFY